MGLPAELSALPHVESSFRSGGLFEGWRRRAVAIHAFDRAAFHAYRFHGGRTHGPYRSTVAAAQLLQFNYDLLGTWPLALTAYNHGASGMRRAKEKQGTDDIVTIIRTHQSRTFGFASRNYYVAFLAALEIDRNPEQYFGELTRRAEVKTQSIELPAYVPVSALERTLGLDRQTLRALNPSLTAAVWSGERYVPRVSCCACLRRALQQPIRGCDSRAWRRANDSTHRRSIAPIECAAATPCHGSRPPTAQGGGADATQRSAQRQPGPRRESLAVAGLGAACRLARRRHCRCPRHSAYRRPGLQFL